MIFMKQSVLLFTILMMGLATTGCAQKMGRYHKNLKYEAELYFMQGDFYYASELYSELLKVAPNDAEINGRLGISYYHVPPMKEKAQPALEYAVELGDADALFYLAKLRHEDFRFHDALDLLAAYERRPERTTSAPQLALAKAAATRAVDFVKNPLPVKVENMGYGVNSPVHDYAPVRDFAGDRLYFTSRRRFDDKSEKDFTEQFDENIYLVDLNESPLKARPAEGAINSRTNDAAVACSPDGEQLMIYRTSKDGYSGNLYTAARVGNSWAQPQKLGDNINSKHQEASASFGNAEQAVLYFSSDRPDGFGGKDIYKVQKLPDGSWGEAQNLGPGINTPQDEDAPFIAEDGTLYFASQGHENMGGYDIFYALPSGDGFSDPTNMGYPINTPADDIFFSIDPQSKLGFFSSDRKGGFGLQDLYSVKFDEKEKVIYRGRLIDRFADFDARAVIRLEEADATSNAVLYQTETGKDKFVFALDKGKEYTLTVEAVGYDVFSKSVVFRSDVKGKREIEDEIFLNK